MGPANPAGPPDSGRHTGTAVTAIARSGGANIIAAGVAAVANFTLVVLITHLWAIETAGQIFAVSSIFLICVAVSRLGVDNGLVRFLAWNIALERVNVNGRIVLFGVSTAFLASLVVMLAGLTLASPLARLLAGFEGEAATSLMIQIFAVAIPIATAYELTLAITRGHRRMRPTILIERLSRPLMQVVLVVVAGLSSAGPGWLAGAWVAPYAIGLVAALLCLPNGDDGTSAHALSSEGPAAQTSDLRDFWKFTIPRGLTRIAQVGLQRADVAIVTALAGPGAGATYTAATRFLVLGQLASTAMYQVSEPQLARLLAKGRTHSVNVVGRQLTLWIVTLVWPIYLLIAAYAEFLLGTIFGSQYESGALVLQILAAAMLVATAIGPVDVILITSGRSGLSLLNMLAALATDIVLCLLLVPHLGITGAAISWAAAIILRNLLCLLQVRRILHFSLISSHVLFIGASLLLLGLVNFAATTWFSLNLEAIIFIFVASCVTIIAIVWAARQPLALSALRHPRSVPAAGGGQEK